MGAQRAAWISSEFMTTQQGKPGRGHWSVDEIPWDRFDPSKVDPEMLKAVKGACLVEHHADDYVTYLCSVFDGDSAFQAEARAWGIEEIQHGAVLRRWCELADPAFDFERSFRRYTAGHILPLDARLSVRGTRTKELIARCIVEVATSSFYSAMRDAAEEPVLRHICHRIAGDEYRHFKLFYSNMKRYRAVEKPGVWAGLKVVVGRLAESADDELAYAYYCGNGLSEPYHRRRHGGAYARRTMPLYRYEHFAKALAMALRAVGLRPRSRLGRWLTTLGWAFFRLNTKRHELAAA